jgi:hypothetical protein
VEPVTAENMYDPSMPWLPSRETCPEFYKGREGGSFGPGVAPGLPPVSPGAPPIDPSDASEFSEWGGPWYLEGPSCWTSSDC